MKRTGKRALCLLVSILLLVSMLPRLPAVAADMPEGAIVGGSCGENLSWFIYNDGTLTISGTGPMDGYSVPDGSDEPDTPWYVYRMMIIKVVIEEGVTAIGKLAFYNCTNLTEVTIAKSVTTIGSAAFRCCTGLSSVTIPEGVISIGKIAFYDCTGLTNVTLPGSVAVIGEYAFGRCGSLNRITFRGSAPFMDPLSFPNVTATAYYPCNDKTWNETVTVDYGGKITWEANHNYVDRVCTICRTPEPVNILYTGLCGSDVIYQLDDRGTLTISGKGPMTSYSDAPMEGGTFINIPWYYVRALITNVVIKEGVTEIGKIAFLGCTNLVSVTIPDSVQTIESRAFDSCSNLTSVIFLGSAPVDNGNNYYDAAGYYPCNDPSWTESVKAGFYRMTWKGHIFSDYVLCQEAACEEDAMATGTCAQCGATATVALPGTATGHPNCQGGVCQDCGEAVNIILYLDTRYLYDVWEDWFGADIEVYADGELLRRICTTYVEVPIPYDSSTTYTFKWSSGESDSSCALNIWLDDKLLASTLGSYFDDGETICTLEPICKHQYEVVTTPPTCTDDGLEVSTCTVCGSTKKQTLPAIGHSYQKGVWITQNSCIAEGEKSYTCSTCGHIKYVTFPATGHDYQITVIPVTCTDYGYEFYACKNCDSIFYNQVTPPTGHKYVDGKCECGDVRMQGDITCDGKLNMGDVAKLYAAARGKTQLDEAAEEIADLTGDGKINMGDVAKLASLVKSTD